jgi:hypothetical protein
VPVLAVSLHAQRKFIRRLRQVFYVNRALLKDCAPHHQTPVYRPRHAGRAHGHVAAPSGIAQLVVFDKENTGVARLADPHCPFGNRFEHRLHVGWRAGNHPQHLTYGRLLVQRFFRLVEEPGVFDGDHCLVGERLQQRNLLIVEAARHVPAHGDGANRLACAQHRDGELTAGTQRLDHLPRERWHRLVAFYVLDEIGTSAENHLANDRVRRGGTREYLLHHAESGCAQAMARHHLDDGAVIPVDPTEPRPA